MKQSPCPRATALPTRLGKGAPLNTSLKLYSPVVAFRMYEYNRPWLVEAEGSDTIKKSPLIPNEYG